jgi:hypothetical protein
MVYGNVDIKEEIEATINTDTMVQLRRIRTGHSLLFRKYQVRIRPNDRTLPADWSKCRHCQEEEESLEHTMMCPRATRWKTETGIQTLPDICSNPIGAVKFFELFFGTKFHSPQVNIHPPSQ